MKYEISNLKENREPILSIGSKPRFVTESIEFDLFVETEKAECDVHLKVKPMLYTDFQEYVERIANKIAENIEEKSATKLDNMYIIKFKACNGIYKLNLLTHSLNYNGEVDNDVLRISGTTITIADSHFQEKIDRHLIEDLKDEIKEQIQRLGYKFEFIEDQNLEENHMDDLTFDKLKEDMRKRCNDYMRNTTPYNIEVEEASGFFSGVMWTLKKLNKLGLLKEDEEG